MTNTDERNNREPKKGWRIECPSQYIAQIMAEHIIKSNDNRFKIDEVCLQRKLGKH